MYNIIAYTGGKNEPSARFRIRQYVEQLKKNQIKLVEYASSAGAYPPENMYKRPIWAISNLTEHFIASTLSYKYDAVIFQREMFSSNYTFERVIKKPKIFDVDDAIWLQRKGDFAKKIAMKCDKIICGNSFLANYFNQWNNNIEIIPTAVDVNYFKPLGANSSKKVICWSGTSSNFHFIEKIESALEKILNRNPDSIFRLISNKCPNLKIAFHKQFEFVKWTPLNEVTSLQDITVGIMPLDFSDWSRGKCSFKMLTYMACAKPVVVTPVGLNCEILDMGKFGFGALSLDDWEKYLNYIINNKEEGITMGKIAREIVENKFSIESIGNTISSSIKSVL